MDIVKLGRNGRLALPRSVMKRLRLQGDDILLVDISDDGVIQLRPAAALPIEMYASERIAEFERECEVDAGARASARQAVDTANG